MNNKIKSLRIAVHGRVQGVCFRAYTTNIARTYGITGYVKNLYNGDVEILAQAHSAELEKLIAKIRIGPPAARVDSIETEEISDPKHYEAFKISF